VDVPDNFAGGEGKCKRCGWRVRIPRPGEQQQAVRAARPQSAAAGHGGAAGGGGAAVAVERDPRTRRRKKSNTGVLVASWMIVIFLLVLVGVAIYAARRHQHRLDNPEIRVEKKESSMVVPDARRLSIAMYPPIA
jgi:hypothetical protein